MMKRKTISWLLATSLAVGHWQTQAQTVFNYGEHQVTKEEFLEAYQKHNQQKTDYSEAAVRDFIDRYALFRMRVAEALDMQLDTTTIVKNELNNYKSQLVRGYLEDSTIKEELVKTAYQRLKEDLKVSHILIPIRMNEDTLSAYKLADSLYRVASAEKADFAELARRYSSDQGSAPNGGDIGYITALRVVYPFEEMAYKTPKGKVSSPFRTPFGYHVLKVTDRRPSEGKVKVQQILIAAVKNGNKQELELAKSKMKNIQQELKAGVSFEKLVEKYSEDKFSKDKNGVLEPFGRGSMAASFEEAAFALKKSGDISEPIITDYGIHLIRLIEKQPMASYEDLKEDLVRQIENDSRYAVAKEAAQEKIKLNNGYKHYQESFDNLVNIILADTLESNTLTESKYANLNQILFELGARKYTQADFMNYVMSITKGRFHNSNRAVSVNDLYKMYQTKLVTELEENRLINSRPDFVNMVKEYRDGILLFNLMEQKVWAKATQDTAGLRVFYEKNENQYQWQPGFTGTVYQSGSDVDMETFYRLCVEGYEPKEALQIAINNPQDPARISQESGRFEWNKFRTSHTNFVEGKVTPIFNNDGHYTVVYVEKLHPQPEVKSLEEAKGFAIADYQEYLEQGWNKALHQRYPVKINANVVKSIAK